MAYAFTSSIVILASDEYLLIIDETDCGPTDEATIDLCPPKGAVKRQICVIEPGGALTVDPILGWQPDPGGTGSVGVICENADPSSPADTEGEASYSTDTGPAAGPITLYHRSRPNQGLSTIHTRYLLRTEI